MEDQSNDAGHAPTVLPVMLEYAPQVPKSAGLAIASMVLGIVALASVCMVFPLGVPLAIVAIVFGIVACRKVAKGTGGGKGMAIAGLVLGIVQISISVVLMAAFLPPLLRRTSSPARARTPVTQAAVKGGLNHAVETFRLNHGRFPEQLKDLVAKPPANTAGYEDMDLWMPYLMARDLQDVWGNGYGYRTGKDLKVRKDYELWSFGPDGLDGTEDDVCNWDGKK